MKGKTTMRELLEKAKKHRRTAALLSLEEKKQALFSMADALVATCLNRVTNLNEHFWSDTLEIEW